MRELSVAELFATLPAAQAELDVWVAEYNDQRPHQGIGMEIPAARFHRTEAAPVLPLRTASNDERPHRGRGDGEWVARRATAVGVITVNWQQVCLGVAAAGRNIDVWVTDQVLQCYDGDTLLRTEKRDEPGKEVRRKRAQVPGGQRRKRT